MKTNIENDSWILDRWLRPAGDVLSFECVLDHLRKGKYKNIHIGTDSQEKGLNTVFVTSVCFYTTSGVNYFYAKTIVSRSMFKTVYLRLKEEIQRSISLGDKLREELKTNITVHADINSLPRGYSNRFNKEFSSYVNAMGFEYRCKPNSWAANTVANWHTK